MWMLSAAFVLSGAPAAFAQDESGGTQPQPSQDPAQTGGREYGSAPYQFQPTVPGLQAKIVDGIAYAPELAPDAVKQAIWTGNQIVGMPYRYGGGHKDFQDTGYDCSGTVSFALHGGGLLNRPRDSSGFARFGVAGGGQWITIYTNPGHAYVTIAGIRLDTSAADDPRGAKGPQWRMLRRSNRGYRTRHPLNL
jgi:hypothetical protein